MNRLRFAAGFAASVLLSAFAAACQDPPGATTGGHPGEGGGGGGCSSVPHPSFTLEVEAESGAVPPDTKIQVVWSADQGAAPFALDDKTTWKSLEMADIVCAVDPKQPPPTTLAKLTCELWTSGATEVVVTAKGYVTSDQTYTQKISDHCPTPPSVAIGVKLAPDSDASAM